MSRRYDNLDEALRAVEAGRIDGLAPVQIARLEQAVNSAPALADRLAEHVPALDPGLRTAIHALETDTDPAARAWEEVRRGIDAAAPVVQRMRRPGVPMRILRIWRPLAAVAACILLVVIWRVSRPAPDPWPFELATNVEIDELEVPEGTTPFVVSSGDNAFKVIWVLPDQS